MSRGWRGATGGLDALHLPAPAEGDWRVNAWATGEGHACVDGRIIYGRTSVRTEEPITLTVRGGMLYLPEASRP